jgi:hypothetical protein
MRISDDIIARASPLGPEDTVQPLDLLLNPGEKDDGTPHDWSEISAVSRMVGRKVKSLPVYQFRRSATLEMDVLSETPAVMLADSRIVLVVPEKVNLSLVCEMAERDMGLRLGEIADGTFTTAGSLTAIEIPEGDPERWRQVFLTRIAQPEEAAYLERGPNLREPDFTRLGPTSSLEELRAWALAHYAASGIKNLRSIDPIKAAQNAQFQVFLTPELFRQVSIQEMGIAYPVKVHAYAKAMRDGTLFPPLVLWRDGKLRLLEGFHRLHARVEIQASTVAGVVFSP